MSLYLTDYVKAMYIVLSVFRCEYAVIRHLTGYRLFFVLLVGLFVICDIIFIHTLLLC